MISKWQEVFMQAQKALRTADSSQNKPVFVEAAQLIEGAQQLTQEIARRAYGFFEVGGRVSGHDAEDWCRAEAELLRPVPVELIDSGDRLIVKAEVPGFKAEAIRISIEPYLLFIEGHKESSKEETSDKVVFNERSSDQFFRSLTLPAEVDQKKVTASLKDGMLEVALPKAAIVEGNSN
jgi:HSP20 family protein